MVLQKDEPKVRMGTTCRYCGYFNEDCSADERCYECDNVMASEEELQFARGGDARALVRTVPVERE